ncbi:unnamed protein product, partial [Prunus brigantina]
GLELPKIPDFVQIGKGNFTKIGKVKGGEEKGREKLGQNWVETIRVSLEKMVSSGYKMWPLLPNKGNPHPKSKLPLLPTKTQQSRALFTFLLHFLVLADHFHI